MCLGVCLELSNLGFFTFPERRLLVPDDEGFSLPGELPLGSYASGEMDLGEALRPVAGFGRDLGEVLDEEEPWGTELPGVFTAPFDGVRYVSPDQLETWASVRGWQTR